MLDNTFLLHMYTL